MATSYPGATGILGEAPAPLRRFNPRTAQIPVGQAIEGPPPMQPPPRPPIPVGQATEFPRVPVGQATEMLPTGQATEIPPQRQFSPRSAFPAGGGASPEAQAYQAERSAPRVAPPPAQVPTPETRGYAAGQRTARFLNSPGMAAAGKVAGTYFAAKDATEAVDAWERGDQGTGLAKGIDAGMAVASSAMPAGLGIAAAYQGGKYLGGKIYDNMGLDSRDLVGRGVNSVLNFFGAGIDNSAERAQANGLPGTPAPKQTPRIAGTPADPNQPGAGQPMPPSPTMLGPEFATDQRRVDLGRQVPGAAGAFENGRGNYSDAPGVRATMRSDNGIGSGGYSPGSAFTAGDLYGPDGNVGTQATYTPPEQGPTGVNPGQAQMLQAKMLDMATNQAKYGGTAVVRQAIAAMQPMLDQALGNGAGTIASMREGGDMARARMTQGSTLRGQDLDMYGKQLSSQTTRAIARMDQMQKDRAYQLDVEKFGLDVAKQRLTQRDSNAAQLKSKLETMYPGEDGKPDANKVALATRGVNAYIDSQVQRAQQIAQQLPPGSPEQRAAMDAVEQLQTGGANAIDPTRLQQLLKQLELQGKAEAGHSAINMFKPTYVHSDNPADYNITGERKGLIQDDYVTANGTVIPKRMVNIRDGGVIPTGTGVQDKSFDILKRTIRQ